MYMIQRSSISIDRKYLPNSKHGFPSYLKDMHSTNFPHVQTNVISTKIKISKTNIT